LKVAVDIRLSDLWCLIPNESADEPYLWCFFLKLDGDTVHQLPPPNGLNLGGHVGVHSTGGSHGNLGVKGVTAQRHISIPNQIGSYSTTLKPIPLVVPVDSPPPGGPYERTVYVPGQLIAVAALMEEDDSPDDGIERGHQSLRAYIEQRVNDFVITLNLVLIKGEADKRAGGDLITRMIGVVNERIDALIADIRANAKSVITLQVLGAHSLGAFWEFADPDDLVGAETFRLDERALVTGAPNALLMADIGAVQNEGLYRLLGSTHVAVTGSPTDLGKTGKALRSTPVETTPFTFEDSDLCIEAGQKIEWTRLENWEEETFLFLYPFLAPQWSLGDQALDKPSGEIRLVTNCSFPFFDGSHPSGPAYRTETREVVISYETFKDDAGLNGVRLRNRPEDGSYYATLKVVVSGWANTSIPIATADFGFDGQAIVSSFYDEYRECIDRITGIGRRYSRFKDVGPRELWGPWQRQRWYEQQVQRGEQLARAGVLDSELLDAARTVWRQQLRLESEEVERAIEREYQDPG
jgi:hypothetical protein